MTQGIGHRFQQETKYRRESLGAGGPDWNLQAEPYKEYVGKPRVRLPAGGQAGPVSLDEALRTRASFRDYSGGSIALEQLSYLLWASGGVQRTEGEFHFRTVPSAGALYPIETYVIANHVAGLSRGVYHYAIRPHALEELHLADSRLAVAQAALGQEMCYHAAVVVVWTAVYTRSTWKYRERAFRYIYLDAGHMAQNLALGAAALGLGSCQIGALFDDEVNRLIGVDGNQESVVYMSVVGPK